MSICQLGILNIFRIWQAYRMPQANVIWLIGRVFSVKTHSHPESRRAASLTTASKTKALRIIFAGKLGSTPAVITLLTANNRNVFISLLIALMRANVAAASGGVIAAAAGAHPVRHVPGRRKNTAPG
jgi:hypothetical protein